METKNSSVSNYLLGVSVGTAVASTAGILYYNWKKTNTDSPEKVKKYNDRIYLSSYILGASLSLTGLSYYLVRKGAF